MPDGTSQPYYDCAGALAARARSMAELPATRILVVIDGPPAATGKAARYPALPSVLQHFKHAAVDLLLDDYIREDEKQIAERWMNELEQRGFSPSLTARRLEKDACVIRFRC